MGEFDDRALMELFGESGLGVFPVAAPIADAVMRHLQVRRLGVLEEIRERFYAITVERRVSHPGVAAICAAETRFDRRGRKVDHSAPL
jgi:LysR family transcriptional activator of nhaA